MKTQIPFFSFALSCLALVSAPTSSYCDLIRAPRSENLEHYVSGGREITLHYGSADQIDLSLKYWGALPNDAQIQEHSSLFTRAMSKTREGKRFMVNEFRYGHGSPVNCSFCKNEQVTFDGNEYQLYISDQDKAAPRHYNESSPHAIKVEGLSLLLQGRRVAIICGDKVGVYGGVADKASFIRDLGYDSANKADALSCKLISDPESILSAFRQRTEAGLYGQPSIVHRQLVELAHQLKTAIIQASFDGFFDKLDVDVIHYSDYKIKDFITELRLRRVDCILCFGHNDDTHAILANYKILRPDGLIVGIGTEQASFLSPDDFWVNEPVDVVVSQLLTQRAGSKVAHFDQADKAAHFDK